MRHATGECDQLAPIENWHSKSEVVKMASGRVGVVRDQNIPGLNARKPKMLDFGLNRFRHPSDEHW